ncbi:MAG: hypothetical protein E2O39_13185 [Planctomycetota bacterium]|nr:MAG: hypothetical protein E2O39_13185 [Planctomycetota bacterium]
MAYQPRTIALLCELFHPPLGPDPRPIQKLHNQMFESGEPAYSSFAVTPAGPVLSNPVTQPGAASQVAFLPDRFQFREEMGGLTHESFSQRVLKVAENVAKERAIQVFTGQQVTLRSLINPRTYKDTRTFLKEAMFGFGEELEALGREPQLFGLRLVFAPANEKNNAYALRIESYNNDPRSLYIEVQGTFGPTLAARGFEVIAERVIETYGFLTERALPFVARFDTRQEA